MNYARLLLALPVLLAGGTLLARRARVRQEEALDPIWASLVPPARDHQFMPSMVASLPAPAQRYFLHAIAPGTPLAGSVLLSMHGAMRLSQSAGTISMKAEQVLSPPRGLVWKARVGSGLLRLRGFDRYSDEEGALRWWLYGLLPFIRASGPDVTRSAAGRVAGEAVLVPSTLLPRAGVAWQPVDAHSARVTMQVGDEPVSFTISVDGSGRLQRVSIKRWRGPQKGAEAGYDRFVVDGFTDERTFGGYTIPTRFRAGWRLGEPDAFPFFYAVIDAARYR